MQQLPPCCDFVAALTHNGDHEPKSDQESSKEVIKYFQILTVYVMAYELRLCSGCMRKGLRQNSI
ncbi:hypothetical protein OUZ56_030021 [Daphnia magna]|uniref:Uncharacterized protein n=1 Tax=Daphnia magna TaxID=35525 RepID=A0ABR0B8K4_9CRUS|nr:hypothetical protein OUZ56_030021 [Daphnia magna]